MSELTVLKSSEETGREIYKTNQFFRHLAHVMEHPEWKALIEENVQDCQDLKIVVMFMFIYFMVGKYKLTPYQKIAAVQQIVNNQKIRHHITKTVNEEFGGVSKLTII
jgi:hypothetical protein